MQLNVRVGRRGQFTVLSVSGKAGLLLKVSLIARVIDWSNPLPHLGDYFS